MTFKNQNERFKEVLAEENGKIPRFSDEKTGKIVAFRSFKLRSEEGGVPWMTLRQISLLNQMEHKNVASLEFIEDELNNATLLNVALEYPGVDLTKFQEDNPTQASDPELIKILLKQLLHGVAYYHSTGVPHGNLNPHNVLIEHNANSNEEYSLKITNLETQMENNGCYTAPELFLGSTELSFAADMFSVGCIFAEMLNKKPLFQSKEGAHGIFRLMGTPNEENWPGVTKSELYKQTLSTYKKNKPTYLPDQFSSLEPAGHDLLSKLLCLNPTQRITAVDALTHGYFTTTSTIPATAARPARQRPVLLHM